MKSRSALFFAFILAMGAGVALGVALGDRNAGISLGAAMFVVFAMTARRSGK